MFSETQTQEQKMSESFKNLSISESKKNSKMTGIAIYRILYTCRHLMKVELN